MRKINPNLKHLCKSYNEGKSGSRLEGSSRSGKTWSSIDFIVWLATVKEAKGTLHIVKDTFNGFKTTLYDDFKRRLDMYQIQHPFHYAKEVKSFNIFDISLHFIGADKVGKAHGAGSDWVWFNEIMDINKDIFDQKEMRCRGFWWADYNPSEMEHYIYPSKLKRKDLSHIITTFKDNPFISENELRKILSYEPTKENIEAGTADEYMWKVYGMGERAVREGVIFKNWKEGKIPSHALKVYGMDFGYSQDPTALVEVGIAKGNLYCREVFYEKGLSTKEIANLIKENVKDDCIIIADSAEPRLIDELYYTYNINIEPAKKGRDSIRHGIQRIKEHTLVVDPDSENLKNELRNYVWSEKKTNTPIDGFNHIIDSVRYAIEELDYQLG